MPLSDFFFHAAPNSVVPAKMRKSGPFWLSPSAGVNFTDLTLRLRVMTEPAKPFSVRVKVPIVAIMKFLLLIGPRPSRSR